MIKKGFTYALLLLVSLMLVASTGNTSENTDKEHAKDVNSNEKDSIVIGVAAEPLNLLGSMTPDFSVGSVIQTNRL
ncbi:hypothetical protein CSV79_13290 [Sporosarcina sp. P13]|uniref:hypothetical protein n=1 Tax=Sporosarcina sp. P13 TaxID=2048263 RepID=UPI000C16C0D8|nr:hypothetical protein [Sporosarcina sp. P13]PIC63123.1 hypothetical protein CSV79_13290 [Sporosarcina sp. P13]